MFYDRLAIVVLDEEKNRHVVTTTDLQDGDDMTYIIYFSESLKADLMFDYPEMTKSPVLFTWGQERHWMDCVSSKSEGESEPNSESLR